MNFSITTSRRLELFKVTLASLVATCVDINTIEKAILIDDGSSEEDLQSMVVILGNAIRRPVIVSHIDAPQGRTAGMRRWFGIVEGEHCFHIEDDWEFVKPFQLSEIVKVLYFSESIGQVALSKSGELNAGTNLGGFWIWHKPERYPHFTTNPHVSKLSAIRKVGNFEKACTSLDTQPTDEFCYGLRWMHHGYRTAYTWDKICKHIGSGQSAYQLNGTTR